MMSDIQMNLLGKPHHLPLGGGRVPMYEHEIDVGVVTKLGVASCQAAN
jgi:hypothetical protein